MSGQERPKSAQERPQERPRGAQERPKSRQERPRSRQEPPNLAAARISADTDLEGVEWYESHISVLEREGPYDAAIALHRQLKEWYDRVGMSTIAGEFHYREREAARKAEWHKLQGEMLELVRPLSPAWEQLRNVFSTHAGRE